MTLPLDFLAGCFQDRFSFPGMYLANVSAASALECQTKCRNNSYCNTFEYVADSNDCSLRTGEGDTVFYKEGVLSGPKLCTGKNTNLSYIQI